MKQEIMYGCPICEFSDKSQDSVFDHILLEHGDEAIDMKPIELGEFDNEEAGQVYERTFKKEKIEKTELKITPKLNNLKKLELKIEEMQTQIIELQKENKNGAYQLALTRQRITKLESYLTTKTESSRRDFTLLAVDLKKEVLKRGRRGLNYNDTMMMFRFKSPQEAYRLMGITSKLFSDEIRLHKAKTKKQSNKLIPFDTGKKEGDGIKSCSYVKSKKS